MHLEPVQEQLLVDLVEAARRVRPEQRQHFAILRPVSSLPGVLLRHPGWNETGRRIFEGDIDVLSSEGLVAKAHVGGGRQGFYVTPSGFDHYADLRRSQGQGVERIESAVKQYLDGEGFRQRHTAAYEKWLQAEELLWRSDSTPSLTTIGHLCREAMQEFADGLVKRLGAAASHDDKIRTVDRIRAVIALRSASLGDKERSMLNALIAYWGAVNDVVQRQEHGALREGEGLVWIDARRVVFQVASVMFEIDAALSRSASP